MAITFLSTTILKTSRLSFAFKIRYAGLTSNTQLCNYRCKIGTSRKSQIKMNNFIHHVRNPFEELPICCFTLHSSLKRNYRGVYLHTSSDNSRNYRKGELKASKFRQNENYLNEILIFLIFYLTEKWISKRRAIKIIAPSRDCKKRIANFELQSMQSNRISMFFSLRLSEFRPRNKFQAHT